MGVFVGAVEDGLKMQMAAGGGPGGSHPRNDLANPNRVALFDGDPLKVVVGGHEAVAVIDFHTVSATPGVPADCPHHSGVGGIDPGTAWRRVVLAPVEFAGRSRDGADSLPKGRGLVEGFEGSHQEAFCGPFQSGRCNVELHGYAVPGRRQDA
ncbi:hypothetical protein ABIB49_000348 [Arthrobacter sp. UYCu512]